MKTWKNFLSFFQSNLLTAVFSVYRWTLGAAFFALGARCRFEPTCSQFGESAMRKFGLAKGGVLAVGRICRCHPLNKGGADPVPDQFEIFRRSIRKSGNG